MGAHSWPSLGDQLAVASALYGNTRCVDSWLAEQFSYVDDLSFARQFSDHISLRGIAPLDYAHRLIETSHGDLLGGIRFYNRDIRRPFVEVIAHSFNDLGAMTDTVAQEWAPFGMYHARLRTSPGRFSGRGVELDQTIHAAAARRMAGVDPGVELAPFERADDAIALVAERYRDLERYDSALAGDIARSDADDIRCWVRSGEMQAIVADGHLVGALAVASDEVGWMTGEVVQDEVVASAYAGRGYAAAAQARWAHEANPRALLLGTIARRNVASRRSAERAGRPAVLEDVFLTL